MDFGVIESIEIAVNLDSGENVRLAQVRIVDEDVVTVELPFPEGNEFVPAIGDTVYFSEVDAGLLVGHYVQSALPVDDELEEGERELFSKNTLGRQAKIRLRREGELVLNDGTDYAVMFEKLEAALDNLATVIDDNFASLSDHVHIPTSPGAVTDGPLDPTELQPVNLDEVDSDISTAKVEKVRL